MGRKRHLEGLDGSVVEVEFLPDGQVKGTLTEDVSESLRAAEECRKETKKRPSKTEVKGTPLRLVASLPPIVAQEMDRQCGGDPEKVRAFLRDHPEHLVVSKSATKLPGRRKYIYSRELRR